MEAVGFFGWEIKVRISEALVVMLFGKHCHLIS